MERAAEEAGSGGENEVAEKLALVLAASGMLERSGTRGGGGGRGEEEQLQNARSDGGEEEAMACGKGMVGSVAGGTLEEGGSGRQMCSSEERRQGVQETKVSPRVSAAHAASSDNGGAIASPHAHARETCFDPGPREMGVGGNHHTRRLALSAEVPDCSSLPSRPLVRPPSLLAPVLSSLPFFLSPSPTLMPPPSLTLSFSLSLLPSRSLSFPPPPSPLARALCPHLTHVLTLPPPLSLCPSPSPCLQLARLGAALGVNDDERSRGERSKLQAHRHE